MISTLTFQNGTQTGVRAVDGIKIPNPSSYKVTMTDVDDFAQRSQKGVLDRHRVRSNVYSIECSWDWLSDAELDKLLAAMQAEKFTLKFRNPLYKATTATQSDPGGYTTCTVYAESNKSAELVTTDDETRDYWKFSCSFVEY